MYKVYVEVLLLGHIIGDFYLQSNDMAEKKEKEFSWVIKHSAFYASAIFLILIPFMSVKVCGLAALISILHFIIDAVKYFYIKNAKKANESGKIFVVDQVLHVLTLLGCAYGMMFMEDGIKMHNVFVDVFFTTNLAATELLKWVLALALIHKPANIVIQKLFGGYKPKESTENFRKDNKVGRRVGSLERIIMLLLMSLGQYSAMGLVLTAKSIARYDRISKEEAFAEYYLLGTLVSTLIVVSVALLIL